MVTSKDILSWDPCSGWTLEKIERLLGKSDGITAMDFILSKELTSTDILWAVLRTELIPQHQLDLLRELFITYAKTIVEPVRHNRILNRPNSSTLDTCIAFAKGHRLSAYVDIVKELLDGNITI